MILDGEKDYSNICIVYSVEGIYNIHSINGKYIPCKLINNILFIYRYHETSRFSIVLLDYFPITDEIFIRYFGYLN